MGKNKGLKVFTSALAITLAGVGGFCAWQWDNVKLLMDCKPLVSETQYTEQKNKNTQLESQFQEQLKKYGELEETNNQQSEDLKNLHQENKEQAEIIGGLTQDKNQLEQEKQQEQEKYNSMVETLNQQGFYIITYVNENNEPQKTNIYNGTITTFDDVPTPSGLFAGWSFDGKTVLSTPVELTENKTLYPVFEKEAGLYDTNGNLVFNWDEVMAQGWYQESIDNGICTLTCVNEVNRFGSIKLPNHINRFIDRKSISVLEYVLPDGLTYFSGGARNNGIKNLVVPNSIEEFIFSFTQAYQLSYYEEDGVKYLGNENNHKVVLVSVVDTEITSFEVNPNTKILYNNAFGSDNLGPTRCPNLVSVTIPPSVNYIGANCFAKNSKLEEVKISDGNLKYIGDYAFSNTIVSGTIFIPNSVEYIGRYVFDTSNAYDSSDNPNGIKVEIYCSFSEDKISNFHTNWNLSVCQIGSTWKEINLPTHYNYTYDQYLAEINGN